MVGAKHLASMPNPRRRKGFTMKIAVAAWASLVSSTSLAAQPALEWAAPLPSLEQIEGLCPGVGGNPLAFGEADVGQSRKYLSDDIEARLAIVEGLGKAAGFEEARLQPTDWSGLLMAVDYGSVVPENVTLDDWREHIGTLLFAGGWEPRPEEEMSLFSMNGSRFEKDFTIAGGLRRLAIEIDTFGLIRGYTLRCGEASLLTLDSEEKEGRLAAGSLQPGKPDSDGDRDIATWLASIDCTDPQLRDRLGATDDVGQVGPIIVERYGDVPDVSTVSTYQQRLNTWLRWKLVADAILTEDELWDVEASATPDEDGVSFEALLDQFVAVATIKEESGPENATKVCQAVKDMFEGDRVIASAKASRLAAINAALIAEGTKRGFRVD
ncbi:hypothetical protein WAB17_14080 [Parerythrobacter aurantius]|uniref:hypothetical protein n=1 Tax=Parerythrobacter aurantius TaxID=3127706 RepID=UPI003246A076